MPKFSAQTAATVEDFGSVVDRHHDLDGYSGSFLTFNEQTDMTGMLAGLPDGRCACPHWGYVLKGQATVTYADRTEVFNQGDAYFMAPGHVPTDIHAGTELVMFSPAEELKATDDAIRAFLESQATV